MPPLFFALAAASSGTTETAADRLALLQGSDGWKSSRCCTYPQELLLELESPADIQEVHIFLTEDFSPKMVEVFFSNHSAGLHTSVHSSDDIQYEKGGTFVFPKDGVLHKNGVSKAEFKCYNFCSGFVRILVHEPLSIGEDNLYGQTALQSLQLWGRLCKTEKPSKTQHVTAATDAAMLPGDVGDIARVLSDLGIPLDVVPRHADDHRFAEVDASTRLLLLELQGQLDDLARAGDHGGMEKLRAQIQSLRELGSELHGLQSQRDTLLDAGDREAAWEGATRVKQLQESRLSIAAFYNTNWWIEHMSEGLSPG